MKYGFCNWENEDGNKTAIYFYKKVVLIYVFILSKLSTLAMLFWPPYDFQYRLLWRKFHSHFSMQIFEDMHVQFIFFNFMWKNRCQKTKIFKSKFSNTNFNFSTNFYWTPNIFVHLEDIGIIHYILWLQITNNLHFIQKEIGCWKLHNSLFEKI